MTTAVIFWDDSRGAVGGEVPVARPVADSWRTDLQAAGVDVLDTVVQCSKLVHSVQHHAPDVVVCHVAQVDEVFFSAVALLQHTRVRPLLVFTQTDDAHTTARAVACGVHAYVVNGYAPQRLKGLIALAQARCQHDQALKHAVLELTRRFEARKAVDRAKGILMHARQVSDDDAYRMLRTASMHSNQPLGRVSQQVIESAHFAEAVNRAGQLRMLSQRLVKLYVLQLGDTASVLHKRALKVSVTRVDETLSLLDKNMSSRSSVLGESSALNSLALALQALLATRLPLKKALQGTPKLERVVPIDALAEQLLQDAERLTLGFEQAGAVAPLRVLNLAGRQRMLSQRFAKQALLAALLPQASRPGGGLLLATTQAAFEQALSTLNALPLTTPPIRAALAGAAVGWQALLAGAVHVNHSAGRTELAQASERLLDVFEALSAHYEHSMHMLMG